MRSGGLFWAVILILGGLLLLLNNFGIVAVGWNVIWPLFIVAAGVWLLARAFIAPHMARASQQVVVPLEGAGQARIRMQHGAGSLEVGAGAAGDTLMTGSFGGGLDYRTERRGNSVELGMKTPSAAFGGFPFFWMPGGTLDWSVSLNPAVALTLDLEMGAAATTIDLSALRVTDLKVQTGASSTRLTLPASAGRTHAELHVGAASMSIQIPDGVSARIRTQSGLASVDVDTRRFPQVDNRLYQSPDFTAAANSVDLSVEAGVGSVSIR